MRGWGVQNEIQTPRHCPQASNPFDLEAEPEKLFQSETFCSKKNHHVPQRPSRLMSPRGRMVLGAESQSWRRGLWEPLILCSGAALCSAGRLAAPLASVRPLDTSSMITRNTSAISQCPRGAVSLPTETHWINIRPETCNCNR